MSAARSKRPPLPGLLERPRKRRPVRVADSIGHEVANLLLTEIQDPRVRQVTVVKTTVTDDLSQARIYYSVLDEAAAQEAARGLESAKGFIRGHLARALALRVAPALIFERDRSLAEQQKLERIFQQIKEEEKPDDPASP